MGNASSNAPLISEAVDEVLAIGADDELLTSSGKKSIQREKAENSCHFSGSRLLGLMLSSTRLPPEDPPPEEDAEQPPPKKSRPEALKDACDVEAACASFADSSLALASFSRFKSKFRWTWEKKI